MKVPYRDRPRSVEWYQWKREIRIDVTTKNGFLTRTYYAHYDGTITNKDEKPMKRIFRVKVRKNGNKVFQLQVKLGNKFYSFARVLLNAWDDSFDINNKEQVVVYANGNMFDLRVINLQWKPKQFIQKKLSIQQEEAIRYIYGNKNTLYADKHITYENLAMLYNVSKETIRKVLRGVY